MSKNIIAIIFMTLLALTGCTGTTTGTPTGTLISFSDTETSTGNTFHAGRLNLVVTTSGTSSQSHYVVIAGGDGINGNVVFDKIKPGDSGTITWTLGNNGDLPGTLTMPSSTVTFDDNDGFQDNPETKAITANGGVNLGMGDLMGAKLKYGTTYVLGDAANYVPFSGLQPALLAQSQPIVAGGSLVYTLEWAVAGDVKKAGVDAKFGTGDDVQVDDNIINDDTAETNIIFKLTQS